MKHKSIVLHLLVLCLVFLTTTAKASSDLVTDMVHFDQVYIPVLALTSEEKVEPARRAMAMLEPEWNMFKTKYYSLSGNDTHWQHDFDKVDAYIQSGKAIIKRGTKLKEAHEEFEHIRVVFMGLRARNNIEYFIDHLTRFHEPMERIVLAVKGKTEATLTDKDLGVVKNTIAEARRLWQITSDANLDAVLYGFNKEKTQILHALIEKESLALKHLQKAIKRGNKKEIIQTGLAIKPNFARLFKAFGQFPAN